MDLRGKRVLVTGGAGFLGSHLVERLRALDTGEIVVPRSASCDLTDNGAVQRLFAEARPDLVFHLAARVGGIGANAKNPGAYFYDNLRMGMNVIEQMRHGTAQKLVLAGTICSYPKHTPIPFKEEDLWNGYPEETNAPYGVAKKALLVMAAAYRAQYGVDTVCVLPVNLYGPRDNFDLESSHVIPALIRKLIEAQERGEQDVVLWGDGTPTREFLYVEDCAEALVLAAERGESSDPVNLGSGSELSILELTQRVAALVGYTGALRWDTSRPNGQPRRRLDVTRARERLGFEARTPLEAGLVQTIAWYRAHRPSS